MIDSLIKFSNEASRGMFNELFLLMTPPKAASEHNKPIKFSIKPLRLNCLETPARDLPRFLTYISFT